MVAESAEEPVLPRELKGVTLGISYEALKARLKELRYKITDDDAEVDTATGIPHRFVVVKSPNKEFTVFVYRFYDEKLLSIRAEYNLVGTKIDFERFLSEHKAKYGEPSEVKDLSDNIFHVQVFIYRWTDGQTELEVGYGPPGKDPLGRSHVGTLNWTIFDKALLQAYEEELKRRDPPFLGNQREKEQRLKESKERMGNPRNDPEQKPTTDPKIP